MYKSFNEAARAGFKPALSFTLAQYVVDSAVDQLAENLNNFIAVPEFSMKDALASTIKLLTAMSEGLDPQFPLIEFDDYYQSKWVSNQTETLQLISDLVRDQHFEITEPEAHEYYQFWNQEELLHPDASWEELNERVNENIEAKYNNH